jgi:hypothetical protein
MTFGEWIKRTLPGLELVSWQQAWVDSRDRGEVGVQLPDHSGADYVRRLYAQYVVFELANEQADKRVAEAIEAIPDDSA